MNTVKTILPFDEDSNQRARQYFGEEANSAFLYFEKNFADSEQGIFYFLSTLNNKEVLESLKLKEKEGRWELKSIAVDILSYRPMCKFCQATGKRHIEFTGQKKGKVTIFDSIANSMGIEILSEDVEVKIFTQHINDKYRLINY